MDSSSFARDLISGGRVSIAYVYPVSGCRARARDHDGFRALTP
jgi:hypothetical protein